ncbi:unnamed protein product [Cylindrotheca closterium]|uniref:Uncharacterized protein n=1 Tax=Cylindrotheca closterium TaxID=2856 RepID=A0AAD2CMM7_9STRA|nr:unnamed protein product [Cylindrotheca closterium]
MAISEDAPLSPEEAATCREKAREVLSRLDQTTDPKSSCWVRHNTNTANNTNTNIRNHDDDDGDDDDECKEKSKDAKYFDTHGFLVVPQFASEEIVRDLKEQMKSLVKEHWHPFDKNTNTNGDDDDDDDGPTKKNKKIETFGTDAKANEARGDYFLDSSNRVHYFAEQKANLLLDNQVVVVVDDATNINGDDDDDDGETLITERKISILNKAGHGMHNIPGAFQDYTLSDKMRNLVLDLGWKDPVVPQSMYIFKQAKIGGTVHSHQDSTFLYTTPRQTCLGLWLALDDATLENGCLWARPGSHKEPLRRQFIRNPEYFEQLVEANNKQVPKGKDDVPQLKFLQHDENPKVHWDGGLPTTSLLEEGFIPIEVKAGDLVTFCGTLDHLSLPNFSDLPRHTFQLHLVEGPKEGITWSPQNWLQYPEGAKFIQLVQDNDDGGDDENKPQQ